MDEALQALLDKLAATTVGKLSIRVDDGVYQASLLTTSDAASGQSTEVLADALTSLLETLNQPWPR